MRCDAAGLPPPATVRYNDWRRAGVPDPAGFTPTLPVSVVVPCFEAPGALALALAGLERQTWPRTLLEVVVVDDGSRPPVRCPPDTPLTVRLVRQEDRGFGLARARNAGARAAAHDILIFLDCDVIAESELVAAHARWHHAVGDALTLGFCACVSVEGIDPAAVRERPSTVRALLAGRASDPPWMAHHMAGTGGLTARRDDLFRAVTGNNFGMRREFFREVGGFDESFTRYGGEDTELGYRAQVRGGLLVPVPDAFGWHQGRWDDGRTAKDCDAEIQRGKLANLIPLPGFRRAAPGRTFAVPRHAVTVEAGDAPPERILHAVEAILADPAGDLVVDVDMPASAPGGAWLEGELAPDPRVRLAPVSPALDAFPAAPIHVTVPAAAPLHANLVRELVAALDTRVTVTVCFANGTHATVARAFALHRVRRGGGTAADYGDTATVRMAATNRTDRLARPFARDIRPVQSHRPRAAAKGLRAKLARLFDEARHVRGVRTGWRFLGWLLGAVRWRLRRHMDRTTPAVTGAGTVLGVEIVALGTRSRAVFAASPRVAHRFDGRHLDVALADSPHDAAEANAAGVPAVVLGEAAPSLAVPAFDPTVFNPMGWTPLVEDHVAALGPLASLPASARADRVLGPAEHAALGHVHHVEDVAAFHAGPDARAGVLVRLAGAGVPVRLADRCASLEARLGPELHGLMSTGIRGAGMAEREALSIRMRRAALRDHSLASRARQLCEAAGLPDPPLPPRVSILLATRRPECLPSAIANVARQTWSRLELVLALHGGGFDSGAVERLVARFPHPTTVLRLDEQEPLGSVLNAATAAATGTLLAKMDDDDIYGAEHILDLVLAHEYSGAEIVGKSPATVYLHRLDRTVRQRRSPSETWRHFVTGGTMLIARHDLERAGGWRRVRRHVDRALVEDVVRAGGAVYRTHDDGYILVRHDRRHTWEVDDDWFLVQADEVRAGWCPALAGIDGAPPPP